jgi:hypothetical protein
LVVLIPTKPKRNPMTTGLLEWWCQFFDYASCGIIPTDEAILFWSTSALVIIPFIALLIAAALNRDRDKVPLS